MIGNDLVHLPTARIESNPLRPRWIEKVFSVTEQSFLQNCDELELWLWTLWSIKEATYKIHQRQFCLKPTFNPKEIEVDCYLLSNGLGTSKVGGEKYSIRYQYSKDCIHSIARISGNDQFTMFCNQPELFTDCKSKQLFDTRYDIQKLEYNIPVAEYRKNGDLVPISISHHGSLWIAVVLS